MRKRMTAAVVGIAAAVALATPAVADTTVIVDASGEAGWTFNPDPTTATDYELTTAEASIGDGSLHVLPIANKAPDGVTPQNADKFIAALVAGGVTIADYEGFSFDYLIENTAGTLNPAKHFYVNLYSNLAGSTTFYDCRWDYVATSGSTTSFTTLAIADDTTPTGKGDRAGDGFTCPANADAMPAGSTISVIAVNVGDTGPNDVGVGGYLDAATLTTVAGTTTYDFEAPVVLTSKDQCKDGGWADFGFPNQGACIASLQANANAGK